MIRRRIVGWLIGAFALCLVGTSAWAQQKGTFLPDKLKFQTKKKTGWFPDLDASFNFSFSQSDGVIGVPDGTTLNFGLQLNGGLTYRNGPHEWRNTLILLHTQTKVPTIEPFLKSADKLSLESTYTFRLPKAKWFGIFGTLKAETAVLPGFLVREQVTRLRLLNPDGSTQVDDLARAQTPYQLTAAFAPFQFKQSLGANFLPFENKAFKVDFKVGAGSVQTWTQGGLRIADNADTADVLELQRLQDYVQIGAEAKLAINGVLFGKLLNYSLLSSVMLPFYTSINTNLSFAELINFDLSFKLGLKVFDWLSLNYALAVVYVPLVQPLVQVTNNIVLSITWSIL